MPPRRGGFHLLALFLLKFRPAVPGSLFFSSLFPGLWVPGVRSVKNKTYEYRGLGIRRRGVCFTSLFLGRVSFWTVTPSRFSWGALLPSSSLSRPSRPRPSTATNGGRDDDGRAPRASEHCGSRRRWDKVGGAGVVRRRASSLVSSPLLSSCYCKRNQHPKRVYPPKLCKRDLPASGLQRPWPRFNPEPGPRPTMGGAGRS